MADDVSTLCDHLGIEKTDLLGYSLGGGVGLQTAFRHPDLVRKLILFSTPFKRQGWYPEVLEGMAQMTPEAAESMKHTPLYEMYPETDWATLFIKLPTLLKQDYDWSKNVARIKSPMMLVYADADGVRASHIMEFYNLLGGGLRDAGLDGSGRPDAWLAILPGMSHYNVPYYPELAVIVERFLDMPLP